MSRLRLVSAMVIAFGALALLTTSASAAPKSGCPAAEGWSLWSVDQAADEIFPNLLRGLYPWEIVEELAAVLDATYDKNGDDMMCVKTMWGDHLNPNSHYYIVGVDLLGAPTIMYVPRDNTANATHD
jgi:hypothetical protein